MAIKTRLKYVAWNEYLPLGQYDEGFVGEDTVVEVAVLQVDVSLTWLGIGPSIFVQGHFGST